MARELATLEQDTSAPPVRVDIDGIRGVDKAAMLMLLGHLHENRACAAAYLRAMSERHSPPVTRALSEAAAKYDAVLSLLRQMNTSKDALSNVAGREKLVVQIRQIVSLEAKALDRMEEAIRAIR